ncbi:hypothetical protein BD779DRAFT_1783321 [Infundibulicybe gibba]|nr:hypothetical protein BD779DRAFT_1783321 [Infundibulicybe gibba]
MAQSPLLASFDPFATHPFTNNSGVLAQPPRPSQYPIPIPSPHHRQNHFPTSFSTSPSSPTNNQGVSPPVKSPQPRRTQASSPPKAASSPPQPIFVPFRQATSSPDLILKKKSPTKRQQKA